MDVIEKKILEIFKALLLKRVPLYKMISFFHGKYFKKVGYWGLVLPLLLCNSLWIIHYFKVVPYSIDKHYEYVGDWINNNFPEDRKNKLLIADRLKNASIQLIAGLGDPNPPHLILTRLSDKNDTLKIREKFSIEDFMQKHDLSIVYRVFENQKPYVKSLLSECDLLCNDDFVIRNFDAFPCSSPLLYSIRNFHELLLTVCSHPSSHDRPRVIEYDGFPKFVAEKENIRRLERNGTLLLSHKCIIPESEDIEYSNGELIYRAVFSKPVDIRDMELIFENENKIPTVQAFIEYKTESCPWELMGDGPVLLAIDQSGIGRITFDPEIQRLSQGYNSLYYIKDSLSRVGQMQDENRHIGLDARLVSLSDNLRKVKELQILFKPCLPSFDDSTGLVNGAKAFFADIMVSVGRGSIDLIQAKIRSSREYEQYGYYAGVVTDLRPHKASNEDGLNMQVEIKAEMPAQTDVKVLTRFSSDKTKWSDWNCVIEDRNSKGFYSIDATYDFLQYKLILLSRDGKQSPVIRDLRFSLRPIGRDSSY